MSLMIYQCDTLGAHLTTCAMGGGSTAIHDVVNEAVAGVMRQVFPPQLVLSNHDDIRAHLLQRFQLPLDARLPFPVPDIMTLGEETLYIDTRITDPRGAINLNLGATAVDAGGDGAGVSAEAAAKKKRADYAPAIEANYMQESQFVALVMEHGGRPSKSADEFFHRLARLYEAKLTNLPPNEKLGPAGNRFLTLLRQIVSAALHKATSQRILTCADRVLFTRAARVREAELGGGDSGFRVLTAADIAEAVGGFG